MAAETPADSPVPYAPRRALALDALRGWAIFTMCLSGVIPWTGLPNWMYHSQEPRWTPEVSPPDFRADWAGVTWVDMVFPLFLFAMGAAMPLAMAGRLAKGVPVSKIMTGILGRGLALVFFAIYAQQIMPHLIDLSPDKFAWWSATVNLAEEQVRWLLAIVGFLILFPVYCRFPKEWPAGLQLGVRAAGMVAAFGFLVYINTPVTEADKVGSLFAKIVQRFDIILLILANVAVLGALIWLATRNSWAVRLAVLVPIYAAYQSWGVAGSWVNFILKVRVPWLYNYEFAKYLFVVVPGTVIGDLLLQWLKGGAATDVGKRQWSDARLVAIVAACLLFIVATLVGFQERAITASGAYERVYAFWVPMLGIPLLAAGFALFSNPGDSTEVLLAQIYKWAVAWLVVGFLFEPSQGGIKKDHPTMSYYFVMLGLSMLLLIAFTILIEVFRLVRTFWILIATGQNPMIAYSGIRSLATPLAQLIGLEGLLVGRIFTTLWLKALYGLLKTTALAAFTAACTRLRIVWRT